MNKFVVFLAVILVLVFGYAGWRWQHPGAPIAPGSSTVSTTLPSFTASGTLIRNNPGLKTGVWYLGYEQPGSPGIMLELQFEQKSICQLGGKQTECASLNVPNGQRTQVEGDRNGDVVHISRLSVEAVEDTIHVSSPRANDIITNPLHVSGEARGSWYFEASFPVSLAIKGVVVTSTNASAKGDWMTTDFVPFEVTLNFSVNTTTPAELILHNDNPSGLPQNDKEIRIPVILRPSPLKVNLYFYNAAKDKDKKGNILCGKQGLEKVTREIPFTSTTLRSAVRLLLQGQLTDLERSNGLSTEFPLPGVELKNVSVKNGTATLTFADPNHKLSGGACRVGILRAQVEATAKQFPRFKNILFAPPEVFQP